jgi:hypothetical protein
MSIVDRCGNYLAIVIVKKYPVMAPELLFYNNSGGYISSKIRAATPHFRVRSLHMLVFPNPLQYGHF